MYVNDEMLCIYLESAAHYPFFSLRIIFLFLKLREDKQTVFSPSDKFVMLSSHCPFIVMKLQEIPFSTEQKPKILQHLLAPVLFVAAVNVHTTMISLCLITFQSPL